MLWNIIIWFSLKAMYIQLTLYWFLNLHWRSKSQGQNSPWVVRFIPIAPKDATKRRKKGRKDDWTNERTNKASGFSCGRSSERTWSFPRDIKAVHLLLPFPPHFTIPPLNPEQHQLTICSILRSIDFLHTHTRHHRRRNDSFLVPSTTQAHNTNHSPSPVAVLSTTASLPGNL